MAPGPKGSRQTRKPAGLDDPSRSTSPYLLLVVSDDVDLSAQVLSFPIVPNPIRSRLGWTPRAATGTPLTGVVGYSKPQAVVSCTEVARRNWLSSDGAGVTD